MSSISDIAKKAGVSKMTVSRVLNNAENVSETTRVRIQQIMKEEGYTRNILASTLSRGTSMDVIGVLTGIEHVFSKYYFMELVRAIEGALDEKDHSVFMFNILETKRTDLIAKKLQIIVDQYHARVIKGIVLLGPIIDDERVAYLTEQGVKGIIIGSAHGNECFGSIDVNNEEGVRMLIQHLCEAGHRDIAVINGPQYLTSAQERKKAFCDYMTECRLPLRPEWVIDGEYTKESGRTAAAKLFSFEKRPTAIIAMNDDMAAGVYEEALQRNITIPDDVSVVGFDGLDFSANMNPPLTTIAQPFQAMGSIVARRCVMNDFAVSARVNPVLVKRNSVFRIA